MDMPQCPKFDGKGTLDTFATWYKDMTSPMLDNICRHSVLDGDRDFIPLSEPKDGMHYLTSPDSRITAVSNFLAMDHICNSVHSFIAAVLRDHTNNAASALRYLRTEYGSGFMLVPPIQTPIPTTPKSLNFSRHSIIRNAALPVRRASRSAEKILEKDPNWFKDIQEGGYKAQPQPTPGPSRPIPTDQPTATGIPSSAGKEFWIGEDDPAGMPDQPGDQSSAAPKVPPVHPDAHLPGWYPEWKEDMLKQRDAMIEGPPVSMPPATSEHRAPATVRYQKRSNGTGT
eukprot:gene32368-biopygen2125